jgi:hypothetical protein
VVAVSNESVSLLESKMLDEHGAKYWIASDPGRETLAAYGGGGIPHAYLVDAMGTIVWDGHPASLPESQIADLLKDAFNPALGKELNDALKGAVKYYEKGQYGKAWAAAEKQVADEDAAVAEDAKFLRQRCEDVAAYRKRLTEAAIANKDYVTALDDLDTLARDFTGMDVVAWAGETLKTLDGDDVVKNEIKAWKDYQKVRAKEIDAEGKEKKLKPVAKLYERVVKKYPGTRGAAFAEKALRGLPQ